MKQEQSIARKHQKQEQSIAQKHQKQEQSIVIPKEYFGFTSSEIDGGMNPIVSSGYLKNFKYLLSRPSTKPRFVITSNSTGDVVWEGNLISGAIIYYAHEVLRLKKGHVTSPNKKDAEFTDDENNILAISYDPQKSKGNFEINGYEEYLNKKNGDLQSRMRRLYMFLILPDKQYKTGLDVIAASFSITTIKSFNALRKQIYALNLPLPLVKTEIFFSDAKSDSGQEYDRIDFRLMRDSSNSLLFSFKSRESYLNSDLGLKLLNKIIETHKEAIESSENLITSSEEDIEIDSTSMRSVTAEDIIETFDAEEKPAQDFDQIPF